jgi:hypothetical protein
MDAGYWMLGVSESHPGVFLDVKYPASKIFFAFYGKIISATKTPRHKGFFRIIQTKFFLSAFVSLWQRQIR